MGAARAAIQAARRKLQHLQAASTQEAARSAARSELRKAQADLAVLRQRGAPASTIELAIAQLKVDVAVQRIALERQLASRLLVRASSSGTVTSVLTTKGASTDPTTPIARVQDLDHLVVTVDLSEYDVARVRVGAPADIGVEALGGKRLGGKVSDVSPSGTENGGVVNFPVTIGLDRSPGPRPGMSVSARVIIQRARNVLRVPVGAVHEGDQPSVMLSGPSGSLINRPVELGLRGATYVEVRSGLREGDRVLVPSGGP
jgi:RND family efflux transporter MFP subunit